MFQRRVSRRASARGRWAFWGGLAAGGAALMSAIPKLKRKVMKVTNILRKDHRLIGGMVMTLERTPKVNGMIRRSLFNQIRHQLMAHSQAEEEIFYPAVRSLNFGRVEEYVTDAYREHQNMKDLLQQISNIDPMTSEFDGKVADLRRTIQHHVEEEEGKVLPLAERHMTVEQLEDLGMKFHNRKAELRQQTAA